LSDKITGAPNAFAQVKRGGVQPQPKNDGGKNDVPEEFKLAPDVNPKIGLQPNNQVDKNKEQSKSTLDVNPHVVHSAHFKKNKNLNILGMYPVALKLLK